MKINYLSLGCLGVILDHKLKHTKPFFWTISGSQLAYNVEVFIRNKEPIYHELVKRL